MNLDRFSQGESDKQDEPAKYICGGCGQEIYKGDSIAWIDGEPIHKRLECIMEFMGLEEGLA